MNKRKQKKLGVRAQKLRADIQKANVRLRRLEQSGISAQSDLYNLTVNALERNRFTVPKSKEDESKLRVILYNFLRGKSTVVQAKRELERRRKEFEGFVKSIIGNINESALRSIDKYWADYDIKKLAEIFPSGAVDDMISQINDSGLNVTARNVERGLRQGIESVFTYEIQQLPEYIRARSLGVYLDMDTLVAVMYREGLAGVLAQIAHSSYLQRTDENDSLF